MESHLKAIWGGFDTDRSIEASAWREVLRLMNEGAVEGLSKAKESTQPEPTFYSQIRHSNEVFSAFKVHRMGQEMARLLTDEKGEIKPFQEWRKDVEGIASHQMGSWLRTEYDTAVIRAHNAAEWREFERNKDILPNLRWMPTTSPNPDTTHRGYWERKLTLPIDHPFWKEQHPGNRWNCLCMLEATDEPANAEVLDGLPIVPPQKGLENNPAKDGILISDKHPYFPKSCKECAFYRPKGLKGWAERIFSNRKKDCYDCSYINEQIEDVKDRNPREAIRLGLEAIKNNELPLSNELEVYTNLRTGHILKAKKTLTRTIKHCTRISEIEAVKYLWEHPEQLSFMRHSPLGEGKDMATEKAKKNIEKKKKRGVTGYNVYKLTHNEATFTVKLEVHKGGFEQAYFIGKNSPKKEKP